MSKKDFNFTKSMKRIHEINEWFEQEDIDLEEALDKLKEGKALIIQCKERLAEIDNEFIELKTGFMEEKTPVKTQRSVTSENSQDGLGAIKELADDITF